MSVSVADRLDALIAEADRVHDEEPWQFEPPAVNQPPRDLRDQAEELLGDDADWHRVVVVAWALAKSE
jgi:hypothetical protein